MTEIVSSPIAASAGRSLDVMFTSPVPSSVNAGGVMSVVVTANLVVVVCSFGVVSSSSATTYTQYLDSESTMGHSEQSAGEQSALESGSAVVETDAVALVSAAMTEMTPHAVVPAYVPDFTSETVGGVPGGSSVVRLTTT